MPRRSDPYSDLMSGFQVGQSVGASIAQAVKQHRANKLADQLLQKNYGIKGGGMDALKLQILMEDQQIQKQKADLEMKNILSQIESRGKGDIQTALKNQIEADKESAETERKRAADISANKFVNIGGLGEEFIPKAVPATSEDIGKPFAGGAAGAKGISEIQAYTALGKQREAAAEKSKAAIAPETSPEEEAAALEERKLKETINKLKREQPIRGEYTGPDFLKGLGIQQSRSSKISALEKELKDKQKPGALSEETLTISTQREYENLPVGSSFIWEPTGETMVKK